MYTIEMLILMLLLSYVLEKMAAHALMAVMLKLEKKRRQKR